MNSQVFLTILAGSQKGTSQAFDRPGIYSIGRADQRDIAFADNSKHQNISRHHCDLQIITINPPNIIIIDQQSTHGTFYNGQKINQPTVLLDRDIFTVGDVSIQISLTSILGCNISTLTPTNPAQPTNPLKSSVLRAHQQISQILLPETWQFGIAGEKGISQKTTTSLRQDFKIPIRRVGITFAGLFILCWLISTIYGLANQFFLARKDPVTTIPEQLKNDACSGMTAKMLVAKVSPRQIDQVFWQKHPDKSNRQIGNDKISRQKWCQIAEELVKKTN
jgi:pSer/pThr/pTyr-binding forkhead associated (FHA) protein